jgi:hypothetical protein
MDRQHKSVISLRPVAVVRIYQKLFGARNGATDHVKLYLCIIFYQILTIGEAGAVDASMAAEFLGSSTVALHNGGGFFPRMPAPV